MRPIPLLRRLLARTCAPAHTLPADPGRSAPSRIVRALTAACLALALAACGSGGSAPGGSTPVAEVKINQSTALLTAKGQGAALGALATASDGTIINDTVTWQSSRPDQVAVDSAGRITAMVDNGSAQITASVRGKASAPILVLATAVAPGAILLNDSQISGDLIDPNPDQEPDPANTFQVRLSGLPAPAIGALLVNTGTRPVAGRVVAVDSSTTPMTVTLSTPTLREMFPNLKLEETLDLSQAAIQVNPGLAADYDYKREGNTFSFTPKPGAAARLAAQATARTGVQTKAATGTRALPPFTNCETSITGFGPNAPLPIGLTLPPSFSVTVSPSLDLKFDPATPLGIERFVINATPTFKLEYGITVNAAFTGIFECKVELFSYVIPIGGPLALILGGQIPMGVGFEAGGTLSAGGLSVGAKVEVSTTASAGIECPNGALPCSFVQNLQSPTVKFTPTLTTPSLGGLRLEPSFTPYGYMEASVGNAFLKKLRFDFVKGKAGAALKGSFGLIDGQITDATYASDYKLSLEAKIGAGEKLTAVAAMIGIPSLSSLANLEFKVSTDLAKSPKPLASGGVTADKTSFVTGDTVNITVKLDPATVDFLPVVGPYNVHKVRLFRRTGGTTQLIDERSAIPGDTTFRFSYTSPDAGQASEFFAFVVTTLAPLDLLSLELGNASTGERYTRLVSSGVHSCALSVLGAVRCWGFNGNGDLGDGTTTHRSIPIVVPGMGSDVLKLEGKAGRYCALKRDQSVHCWGSQADPFSLAGNGAPSNTRSPLQILPPGSGTTGLSVDGNLTCGLNGTSAPICWGMDYKVVVNTGRSNWFAPRALGGWSEPVVAMIGPGTYACARLASGAVECDYPANLSVAIQTHPPRSLSFTMIRFPGLSAENGMDSGSNSGCFESAAGTTRCIGYAHPFQFTDPGRTIGPYSWVDTPVTTPVFGTRVRQLQMSVAICGIDDTGSLRCAPFRPNPQAQVVPGFESDVVDYYSEGPALVQIGQGASVISQHTCAIRGNGRIQCQGPNTFGQLGNGTQVDSATPVDVLLP